MNCLVYTKEITPRVTYTFQVLLETMKELSYKVTTDRDEFRAFDGIRINYSNNRLTDSEILLPCTSLLFENTIHPFPIEVIKVNGVSAFFLDKTEQSDFPVDLPAMIFYLVSRYEEYLPSAKDQHGRFIGSKSLAFKNGFLEVPLVNIWKGQFRQLINKTFKGIQIARPAFRFQPTYDIDMAWAFKNRGWKPLLGLIKDLLKFNFAMVAGRWKVAIGKQADPFYSFNYLEELSQKHELSPVWFFLLGNNGTFDKNTSWKNENIRNLIKQLDSKNEIGIHPSYASNKDFSILEEEVMRLARIKGSTVHKSRQHYLKLNFPETFRNLLACGIKSDYTMGYADLIGFRASIANSFLWYDLKKEKITSLRVHPFQVMDVTLKNYMNLSPEQAIERAQKMTDEIKRTGGTFTTLWHNSSFSRLHGWKDWKQVYEKIIASGVNPG